MQEARGPDVSEVELRYHCRQARIFYSAGSRAEAGGLAFVARPEFVRRFSFVEIEVVVAGRIAILRCRGSDPSTLGLDIVSIHLVQAPGGPSSASQLRSLREHITSRGDAVTVLAGDLDFTDRSEGRWSVRRRLALHAPEPDASVFSDLFPEFAESVQSSVARRQFLDDAGRREFDTLSRIDRVWANAPTAFLPARSATTGVEESIFSDQEVARGARRRVIATWVARDARLPALVEAMAKEAESDSAPDPFQRLAGVTECLYVESKRVAQMSRAPSGATAPEW